VALFFCLTGWVRQVPEVLATASLTGLSYLAYAFSLTVVVDAIFIAVIAIFETLVSRLTGKRVEY
jgi:high-affinity nickel permease